MKVKIKKLWILYDYTEKLQEIEKEYDENFVGSTYIGFCPDGIGAKEGAYIIMPVDDDIQFYRKKLINYMIGRKQTEIEMANNEIKRLVNML